MTPIEQITDLIVREALKRQEAEEGDIGSKIHAIQMEVMLTLIDLMSIIRESERQMKRKETHK